MFITIDDFIKSTELIKMHHESNRIIMHLENLDGHKTGNITIVIGQQELADHIVTLVNGLTHDNKLELLDHMGAILGK